MKFLNYIMWWVIVFLLSYTVFSLTMLAPAEIKDLNARIGDFFVHSVFLKFNVGENSRVQDIQTNQATTSVNDNYSVTESVLPTRVIIDKIGVNDPVANPETRDVAVLDQALTVGVVRYPGSGGLTDNSNILFFGHSTNWQVVHNQAYKSFNRLAELNLGDLIKVQSAEMEYLYRVTSVGLVDKNKALIQFASGEKMITLSTCDTFGAKSDRFVVEAKFVRNYPLTSQSQ